MRDFGAIGWFETVNEMREMGDVEKMKGFFYLMGVRVGLTEMLTWTYETSFTVRE